MSTLLRKYGRGFHAITTDLTSSELEARPFGRFIHPVDHPSLWHAGDMVSVETSDGLRYTGMVLNVSALTCAVLIELETP